VPGSIQATREAILGGVRGPDIGGLALPESVLAAFTRKDEQDMFEGMDAPERDPRKSLHVEEVPLPPLGPN
jgi:crotonyl-CoA reductase